MVYDINGNLIGELSEVERQNVDIAELKSSNPGKTDDEILELAITAAKTIGVTSKIVWDGTDISFSGQTTHELKGFAGIDFNNSRILMPNYDSGTILHIVPDATENIDVSASDILKSYTTESNLFGKVFGVNDNEAGNADMCLGNRAGSFSSTIYCSPTIMTTQTGYYMMGDLFLVPTSGTVTCYNVHDYPVITFEISNATVVTNATANMSRLILCERSNTHVHNIKLLGRSLVTSYHHGIMSFKQCCGVEIDHISGVNPIKEELTSGYAIGLYSMTYVHMHDVYIGDNLSWGAVGSNHLTNTTFERCYLNRWDCHYAQYGENVVRDCTLNKIEYGIGNGTLLFETCTIIETRESESVVSPIYLRSDCPGVFDGNIIVEGCTFISVAQPANKIILWDDSNYYEVPENSMITGTPKKKRIIERCNSINGVKSIFKVGSRITADQGRYGNVEYFIRDMDYSCSDVIVDAYDSNQTLGAITIDGCRSGMQNYISKLISNVIIRLINSNFENKTLHVVKNVNEISVSQCRFNSVVSDETSNYLMIIGCRLYGTQDFAKFSNYSAYGNVAGSRADTPALNVNVS